MHNAPSLARRLRLGLRKPTAEAPMTDNQTPKTILIVDDERGPRESLRMILDSRHRILQASSGADALECIRREHVDLMTLDLNMPGMHGQELMRIVRSEFPHIEIVIITGCGSIESAAEGIRTGICDYIQKPFDVVQVGAAVDRALSRKCARDRLTSFLEELGGVVGHDRGAQAILEDVQRSEKLREQVGAAFSGSGERGKVGAKAIDEPRTTEFLEVLAETIEAKDRFMRGHARRVSFYACLLAERLFLEADELEEVRVAAFLHDLGKVGVPTDLLLRAGALDSSERALVEQHPAIGARLVKPLAIPNAIASAIQHHHEWWDGTGYPDGLKGEEIPRTSRIIAVVDAFDAMSSNRPYRRALARSTISDEIRNFAGSQFDPHFSKEFLAIIESGACDIDLEIVADAVSDVHSTTQSADSAASIGARR
jgi:response regulator RpfG family c-di-GMP phosphodiesterase